MLLRYKEGGNGDAYQPAAVSALEERLVRHKPVEKPE
jgi:hypothetical protein